MDLLGITMFSLAMALVGFFQSIPLTAIGPSNVFPARLHGASRMGYVIGTIGEVFDKVFPARYDNGSLIEPDKWSSTETLMAETIVPVATEPATGHSTIISPLEQTTSEVFLENPSLNYTAGCASRISGSNKFDPWLCHLLGDGSKPISSLYSTRFLYGQNINHICIALLGGLSVFLMILLAVAWKQESYREAADAEIMRFIQEIQSRRAFLSQKLDNAASIVDRELDEITWNITTEQERLGSQLASFRAEDFIHMEVSAFREWFQAQVQNELERQISQVQFFMEEVEEARRSIPGPEELQAHYQDFQDELQRSKDQISGFMAQVGADTVSYSNIGGSMKHIEDIFNFFGMKQDHFPDVSDAYSPAISLEASIGVQTPEQIPTLYSSYEQDKSDGTSDYEQQEAERISQWYAATGSPPLTAEQLEKGRRIRHERVQNRLTAAKLYQKNNLGHQISPQQPRHRQLRGKGLSKNKCKQMTGQDGAFANVIGLGVEE